MCVRRFLITLSCTFEQSDNTNVQRVARRRAFSLPGDTADPEERDSQGPLASHADFLRGPSPAPAPRTFLPPTLSSLEGLLEEPKERLRRRPEGLVSSAV